jgi:hypothetical protein
MFLEGGINRLGRHTQKTTLQDQLSITPASH